MAPFEVRLAARAADQLEQLGERRRGMLTSALGLRGRREPRDGLLTVWTHQDVAACEVLSVAGLAGRRVILVYAIRPKSLLFAQLFGPELERRFERLQVQRLLHRG